MLSVKWSHVTYLLPALCWTEPLPVDCTTGVGLYQVSNVMLFEDNGNFILFVVSNHGLHLKKGQNKFIF